MGESKRRTELWVGVFVFIGLALLGGLTVQFGRFGDRLRGKYQLVVVFDDASGLIKGSEIRMGGARIGKVAEHPELNANVKVQVVMNIDEPIRIPENSMIQIASATLLGDKMIVITPPEGGNTTGRFIQPGAVLRGGGPSGPFKRASLAGSSVSGSSLGRTDGPGSGRQPARATNNAAARRRLDMQAGQRARASLSSRDDTRESP